MHAEKINEEKLTQIVIFFLGHTMKILESLSAETAFDKTQKLSISKS